MTPRANQQRGTIGGAALAGAGQNICDWHSWFALLLLHQSPASSFFVPTAFANSQLEPGAQLEGLFRRSSMNVIRCRILCASNTHGTPAGASKRVSWAAEFSSKCFRCIVILFTFVSTSNCWVSRSLRPLRSVRRTPFVVNELQTSNIQTPGEDGLKLSCNDLETFCNL